MTFQNPIGLQSKKAQSMNDDERTHNRKVITPFADIFENEKELIVIVDVPGADDQSIDITLEKNVLTIDASTDIQTPEKHALSNAEYGTEDYHRSFILSNQIDRNSIEADVKNGVLVLHLPKAPEAQVRKINIKASN